MSATQFDATRFNRLVDEIFNNGIQEAGMEVNADAGLSRDKWIAIPRSMLKRVIGRVADWASYKASVDAANDAAARRATDAQTAWDEADPAERPAARPADATAIVVPADAEDYDAARPTSFYRGRPGWVVLHDGTDNLHPSVTYWLGEATATFPGVSRELRIGSLHYPKPTADEARAFYMANVGRVASNEHRGWVLSTRYWSVVAGLATVQKSTEYEIVDTPDVSAAPAEANAWIMDTYAPGAQANALTLLAARAISWRKTNHALGGSKASGFPERVLGKLGKWPTTRDKTTFENESKLVSDAFYDATHAASVHGLTAVFGPGNVLHWARISPACGMFLTWTPRDSIRLRIEANTQVAGVAVIADAMVGFKNLLSEKLTPLLSELDQLAAFCEAYQQVELYGIRVATYSKWYLDGHPGRFEHFATEYDPIEGWGQKDSRYFDLACELATAVTKYYVGSTLAASPALKNAERQGGKEAARSLWTELNRKRRAATAAQLVKAYQAIKGAATSDVVRPFSSADEVEVRNGVAAYNAMLESHAAAIKMSRPPRIDADVVLKNLGTAAAAPGSEVVGDEESEDEGL